MGKILPIVTCLLGLLALKMRCDAKPQRINSSDLPSYRMQQNGDNGHEVMYTSPVRTHPQAAVTSDGVGTEQNTNHHSANSFVSQKQTNRTLTAETLHTKRTNNHHLTSVSHPDSNKAKKVPLVLITIHKSRNVTPRDKTTTILKDQKSTTYGTPANYSHAVDLKSKDISNSGSYGQHPSPQSQQFTATQSPSVVSNSALVQGNRNAEDLRTTGNSNYRNTQIKTANFGSSQWQPVNKNGARVSDKIISNNQQQQEAKSTNNGMSDQIYPGNSPSHQSQFATVSSRTTQAPASIFNRKPIMNYEPSTTFVKQDSINNNHNNPTQPLLYIFSNEQNHQQMKKFLEPSLIERPNVIPVANSQNFPVGEANSENQRPLGIRSHVGTVEMVHFPPVVTQPQNHNRPVANKNFQIYYNQDSTRANTETVEGKIMYPATIDQTVGSTYKNQNTFQTVQQPRMQNGKNNLDHNLSQQQINTNEHSSSWSSNMDPSIPPIHIANNQYLVADNLNKNSQMQHLFTITLGQSQQNLQYGFNTTDDQQVLNYNLNVGHRKNQISGEGNANNNIVPGMQLLSDSYMQSNGNRSYRTLTSTAHMKPQHPSYNDYVLFPETVSENSQNHGGNRLINNYKLIPALNPGYQYTNIPTYTVTNDMTSSLNHEGSRTSVPNNPNLNYSQQPSMELKIQNNNFPNNAFIKSDTHQQEQIRNTMLTTAIKSNFDISKNPSNQTNSVASVKNNYIDPRIRNNFRSQEQYTTTVMYGSDVPQNGVSQTHSNQHISPNFGSSANKGKLPDLDTRKRLPMNEVRTQDVQSSNQFGNFNYPSSISNPTGTYTQNQDQQQFNRNTLPAGHNAQNQDQQFNQNTLPVVHNAQNQDQQFNRNTFNAGHNIQNQDQQFNRNTLNAGHNIQNQDQQFNRNTLNAGHNIQNQGQQFNRNTLPVRQNAQNQDQQFDRNTIPAGHNAQNQDQQFNRNTLPVGHNAQNQDQQFNRNTRPAGHNVQNQDQQFNRNALPVGHNAQNQDQQFNRNIIPAGHNAQNQDQQFNRDTLPAEHDAQNTRPNFQHNEQVQNQHNNVFKENESSKLDVSNASNDAHHKQSEGLQKSSVPEALLLVLVSAQRTLENYESESEVKESNQTYKSTPEEFRDQLGQESNTKIILRSILDAAGRQYRKENGIQQDTVDIRKIVSSSTRSRE